MGMGLRYLYDRSGPLSMAPSQLGAFARSGPEQTSANLEYHVQPLSLERFGEPLHASRRSPRRSATCARRAVGGSISARPTRRTRR
jgi:choline dehydrogenase-like flavoprotein